MSNAVQLNLKSRENRPYRRYPANTSVPEQLPAPLDSASFGIGQLSSVGSGWYWTVPATKSDSLLSGLGSGRAGCSAVAGGCCGATSGDGFGGLADQVPVAVVGEDCVPLPSRGQGRCGVGREAHDPDGIGEPASAGQDVVGHPDHEHSHVITCRT